MHYLDQSKLSLFHTSLSDIISEEIKDRVDLQGQQRRSIDREHCHLSHTFANMHVMDFQFEGKQLQQVNPKIPTAIIKYGISFTYFFISQPCTMESRAAKIVFFFLF